MRHPASADRRSDDTATPWRAAIARAERQGGAIEFRQLLACGISQSGVLRRRVNGTLHERHHGVYALGRPTLDAFGEAWAAVLAARGRGVLTRWSALAHVGAWPWPARPQLLVVGGPLHLGGVDVHRTRRLAPDEIAADPSCLRCTWWPRTIIDLAARSSIAELQDALNALERRKLLHVPLLEQAIVHARGRRGLRKLRSALEPWTTIPDADYRSLLERFSAMLLRRRDLPPHEVNGPVRLANGAVIRVDLLFRDARLAVEVDGRDSHTRGEQFAIDRWRDRELQKLGFHVLRFTWQDIRRHPKRVLDDITAFLTPDACRVDAGSRM